MPGTLVPAECHAAAPRPANLACPSVSYTSVMWPNGASEKRVAQSVLGGMLDDLPDAFGLRLDVRTTGRWLVSLASS